MLTITWVIRLVGIVLTTFLYGCGDTRDRIAAMDQALLVKRQEAAAALASRLIQNPDIAQSGDVQLYLSSALTNEALKLLDNLTFDIPSAPGVTLKVNQIKTDFSDGFAGLSADLSASKGKLTVKVVGIATLVPEPREAGKLRLDFPSVIGNVGGIQINIPTGLPQITYTPPTPLRFRVQFNTLEPSAKWGPFSKDLKGLITEFTRWQVNEHLTKGLPPMEIPLESLIAINQKEQVKNFPIAKGKLMAQMTTSPVKWQATFSLKETVILKRGIHLIGSLSEPTGAP